MILSETIPNFLLIEPGVAVEAGVAVEVATVSSLHKVVEAVVDEEMSSHIIIRTATTVQRLWLAPMAKPSLLLHVMVACLLDTIVINVHTLLDLE